MKKILSLWFAISLCLVLSGASFTLTYAESGITVKLNGHELVFDVPPQIINDRTMVPMRKIFEELGATVDWEGSTQTITAKKDDAIVIMKINDPVITVSDKAITLDVPPLLVNDRTLVPIRAVAESLGAFVEWQEQTQTVLINQSKKFSLIDDRLFIKMPEGTVDKAMWGSEAPYASKDLETELLLDEDGEKLGVYAREYFKCSTGNIENDAKYLASQWGEIDGSEYIFTEVTHFKNADMIMFSPLDYNANRAIIILKSALVKMPDNTLIIVDVYVNSDLFNNRRDYADLAESVLNTLEIGGRKLETSEREEEISFYESSYKISIPKGYVSTYQRGYDFDVHYIRKIATLGETAPIMGIYLGNHPNFAGKAPEGIEYQKKFSTVAGNEVTWLSYSITGILHMETAFNIGDSEYGPKMHIFMSADNEDDLAELRSMVESLR